MNVSSLTPWLSDFHTVWFSVSSGCFFVFKLLLSFFWLCEEAVCLLTPPSWPEVQNVFFFNCWVIFHCVNVPQLERFGQDGGVGRNALLPYTTKRRITTNFKTIKNRKCQKIKVHGTLTTKELKKHSPRLVGGAEMGDRQLNGEDTRQDSGHCGWGGAGWMGN